MSDLAEFCSFLSRSDTSCQSLWFDRWDTTPHTFRKCAPQPQVVKESSRMGSAFPKPEWSPSPSPRFISLDEQALMKALGQHPVPVANVSTRLPSSCVHHQVYVLTSRVRVFFPSVTAATAALVT